MNDQEFQKQMGRIFSEFDNGDKKKYFGKERLELIWRWTYMLPAETFEKIVSHMIANFRQAPLPKDFKEAAIAEKKHALQNGMAAFHTDPKDFEIKCTDCYDAGILYMQEDAQSPVVLMICHCEAGEWNISPLPRWTKQCNQIFKKLPFNLDEWVPGKGKMSLPDMAKFWQERIKFSNQYWSERMKESSPHEFKAKPNNNLSEAIKNDKTKYSLQF